MKSIAVDLDHFLNSNFLFLKLDSHYISLLIISD